MAPPNRVVAAAMSVYPVGPNGVAATPMGYQQLTAAQLATAQHLPNIPVGATLAIIQAEGAAIRWRDDATAPTSTIGMVTTNPDELDYNGDLTAIQLIQAAAGAIANITYYG